MNERISYLRDFRLPQQSRWELLSSGLLRRIRMELSSILILLESCLQICMTHTIAECTVNNSWWWTEELPETHRVSFLKWMWAIARLVGFTVCPTGYRTRHFFNNSNTNEDIATRFEQRYVRCVRNEEECVCSAPNCCDTEQRSKYAGFCSELDTLYYKEICHDARSHECVKKKRSYNVITIIMVWYCFCVERFMPSLVSNYVRHA
jgi:hypothetical protein